MAVSRTYWCVAEEHVAQRIHRRRRRPEVVRGGGWCGEDGLHLGSGEPVAERDALGEVDWWDACARRARIESICPDAPDLRLGGSTLSALCRAGGGEGVRVMGEFLRIRRRDRGDGQRVGAGPLRRAHRADRGAQRAHALQRQARARHHSVARRHHDGDPLGALAGRL